VRALPGRRIEVCATQPPGAIEGFIGKLAGRSTNAVSLEEIQMAAQAGWSGKP